MVCPARTTVLGYIALAYILTAVLYYVVTRFVGTPFNDSLTERQKRIKACSARTRGAVFLLSALIATALLVVVRPLR